MDPGVVLHQAAFDAFSSKSKDRAEPRTYRRGKWTILRSDIGDRCGAEAQRNSFLESVDTLSNTGFHHRLTEVEIVLHHSLRLCVSARDRFYSDPEMVVSGFALRCS